MNAKIFKLYSEDKVSISSTGQNTDHKNIKTYSLQELQHMDQKSLDRKVFVSLNVNNPEEQLTET